MTVLGRMAKLDHPQRIWRDETAVDPSEIVARVARAREAIDDGELELAAQILDNLESDVTSRRERGALS